MSTDYESWSLLKPLLEAVVQDLEESLALNEFAALQTLRSRLILKKCRKLLCDYHITQVSLPALSEVNKTPGAKAKLALAEFIADVDTYIATIS